MDFENKQQESKQVFYHLDICCRYVGEKYGHPNISEWTNGDYIKLSGVLSRQTDVQISPNTLKRIFGKLKTTERYYPQKATRDTLARYAGYKDWTDFVSQHPRPEIISKEGEKFPEALVIEAEPTPIQAEKKKKSFPLLWSVAAAIVVIITIILSYNGKKASVGIEEVKLICNNPEGTNPHSAIFKLQLPPAFTGDPDNFTLNFADGRMPRPIKTGRLITHYYEVPGRYYPVLLYNGTPIDTLAVYLKTDGWTATARIQHDSTRVYPLPQNSLLKNHALSVTTSELFHAGVDTNRTFFVHFVNATPMEISGDNFELAADVVTSRDRPGVRCSEVNIAVYGERAMHLVRVMKPGCSSFNGIELSENVFNGESEDLRVLGTDLSNGGTCRLEIRNKTGILWINGKQVFKTSYKLPIGKIYGLNIMFSGIGELKNVKLRDLGTGKIFDNSF